MMAKRYSFILPLKLISCACVPLFFLFFVSRANFATAAQPSLRIGTFVVDASPPIGSPLAYQTCDRVAMPLTARGIVLLTGKQPIVLCAVDWIGIANDSYQHWRQAIANAVGTTPQRVSVHVLHQHDAPIHDQSAEAILATRGLSGILFDVPFARKTIQQVATAAREAAEHAQVVTHLGLGEAEVEKVASNRRILGSDGKVRGVRYTSCRDPDLVAAPEGIIDPWIKSISFWNDQAPLVVLTYYATHPQSYYLKGVANPDFPGMARFLREVTLNGIRHVHFNGAGGNIGAGKYNDGTPENRQQLAIRLADGMSRAWQATKKKPIMATEIDWKTVRVKLPASKHLDEKKLLAKLDDPNIPQQEKKDAARDLVWLKRCQAGDTIDITCLKLGTARVLHLPGEAVVEYQLAAQKMLPDHFVAVAAYGDYAPGYICLKKHYQQGGYEDSPRASKVAPDVEDVLMPAMKAALQMEMAQGNERQITHVDKQRDLSIQGGPFNHELDNNDNFSPDDRFLVYDARTVEGGIGASRLIGKVEIATGQITSLYQPSQPNSFGPGVGAVSYSHNRDEVLFIHGPFHPTGHENQYEQFRRVGVIVAGDGSGTFQQADARDTQPPYTPGALRGGTHRHEFSGDGKWVGFTYNDAVVAAYGLSINQNLNLRTIGVTRLRHPLRAPASAQFPNQAAGFSALVVVVVPHPKPGSDEISHAAGDSWVGRYGYLRADGTRQLARAFLGTTRDQAGVEADELYLVDIPNDITQPGHLGPLEGTDHTFPMPPAGTVQRRLTYTASRRYPGCLGIVRTSHDGSQIAFLMRDDRKDWQVFLISPLGGKPRQATFLVGGVDAGVRWHPSGNSIVTVAGTRIVITDVQPGPHFGKSRILSDLAPAPFALVLSHDGKTLAYNRRVREGNHEVTHIFIDEFPAGKSAGTAR